MVGFLGKAINTYRREFNLFTPPPTLSHFGRAVTAAKHGIRVFADS